MKHKLILMPLASLLFLGCTKTIKIDNRTQVQTQEPLQQVSEINVVSDETPYIEEPVSVTHTKSFDVKPLEVYDKILENPNLLILDVRTAEEIPHDGKIANSLLIPLQVLSQNLNRLDKSKEIVVYCHTGNRSVEATKLLRNSGFDALNMLGGIEAWKKNHLEVKWK